MTTRKRNLDLDGAASFWRRADLHLSAHKVDNAVCQVYRKT
jgi:hypothetical protein